MSVNDLDQKLVSTTEVQTIPTEEKVHTPPMIESPTDSDMIRVSQFFELSAKEMPLNREKINTLLEYARKMEGNSPEAVYKALANLELKLNTPTGESKISYYSRYASLFLEGLEYKTRQDALLTRKMAMEAHG